MSNNQSVSDADTRPYQGNPPGLIAAPSSESVARIPSVNYGGGLKHDV
jgi:hypothetical protein